MDVGCGEGFALKCFIDLGWEVKGVDLSKAELEQQNPDMVDSVDIGDIYEILSKYQETKKNMMLFGYTMFSRGGVLVVTVPNDGSDQQE